MRRLLHTIPRQELGTLLELATAIQSELFPLMQQMSHLCCTQHLTDSQLNLHDDTWSQMCPHKKQLEEYDAFLADFLQYP